MSFKLKYLNSILNQITFNLTFEFRFVKVINTNLIVIYTLITYFTSTNKIGNSSSNIATKTYFIYTFV